MPVPTNAASRTRLLIADDERLIADTLALIFLKEGYETLAVYSGEAILEELEGFQPDLLLSDVVMTGITGVQAALAMQKTRPSCKILLLSGQADTGDLFRESRVQGLHFELIGKPVDPCVLVAKLKEMRPAC
ncbi:response regulator [Terriglobus saanensis]|uniref:Response regulator receiver protein n=1 Tax=Terriglobus saanensis (strain ATCC BAA-1853 / DSM 23119 / SP1PR4) TaxID=401053 RepID=E8V296_TERSS|nr:response regulator [Terriglobus saanensis]ADV81229.1 response regulator receiver protein [Terriglobus saanensis SP1PR4]